MLNSVDDFAHLVSGTWTTDDKTNEMVNDLLHNYKIKLNEIKTLQDKHLSLIFFQRVENHLLRERFRSNKIKTDDFIKWAFDYKYLRVIEKD